MRRVKLHILFAFLFLPFVTVPNITAQSKSFNITFPPRERVFNPLLKGNPEQTFEELEHKLSDATRSGDQALLDELYGKRLLILGVPYTKEQWIELVVKGKGTFVSIEKSVTHVKIYGDTAITMGMQYVDSKTANGGRSYQHGFMNTWIRSKNGKWECVAAAADQIR